MRLLVLIMLAFGLAGITTAIAQPVGSGNPGGSGNPTAVPTRPRADAKPPKTVKIKDPKDAAKIAPHGDRYEIRPHSKQPGLALLFWAFAIATIGGALFVITRRNLIAAVMGMVGSFLGISAVYMMLYAHFLSVVQMLVYAGAIMVLFVFVIMILNRPEDEPVAPSGRAGQAIAGIAILYLVGRLVFMLINVQPPTATSGDAPKPVDIQAYKQCQASYECTGDQICTSNTCVERVDWGSTKAVGNNLFTDGLFPFEAISLLLLIAVVGAIAIARPLSKSGEDGEEAA